MHLTICIMCPFLERFAVSCFWMKITWIRQCLCHLYLYVILCSYLFLVSVQWCSHLMRNMLIWSLPHTLFSVLYFSVYSVCPSFCLLANKRVAYRNRRCKKTPKNSTIPPSHVCVFLSYRRSNYHYSISLSGQAVRSTHNRQDQRLRMNPKRLTLKPREIWSMAAASPYNSWRNRSIDVCTVPHQVAYWNNAGGDVIYDV